MLIKYKCMLRKSAFLLSCIIIVNVILSVPVLADNVDKKTDDLSTNIDMYSTSESFFSYKQNFKDAKTVSSESQVDIFSYDITDGDSSVVENYNDLNGSCKGIILSQTEGVSTWKVDIKESGFYFFEAKYFAMESSKYAIQFGILIDGAFPFSEARSCSLTRVFVGSEITQDNKGNDIRPIVNQKSQWQTNFITETSGCIGDVCVYFTSGLHAISLSLQENTPFQLEKLTLKPKKYLMSYQDYYSLYKQQGVSETTGIINTFQSENYYQQSNSSLCPESDRTSPLVKPFDYYLEKLNYGGGSQWKTAGNWISWKFNVPEDGFYELTFRYRQNYLDGLFTSRSVYIDGEIPFSELSNARFIYTTRWQNATLGQDNVPYKIYLTSGNHILTMKCVNGDMDSLINVYNTASTLLNNQYLNVVMITGSEPDEYMDYKISNKLPNLSENLNSIAEMLNKEKNDLIDIVGTTGSQTSYIGDIVYTLTSIANNPESLTYNSRLTELKNIISGLSQKLVELKEQALDLDCFYIHSSNAKISSPKVGLLGKLGFQFKTFISSFSADYMIETKNNDKNSIDVWLVSGGSDQFSILKSLIREDYTSSTNNTVNLKLVNGSLIQAIVSGIAPDVVVGIDADSLVNLALRGAVEPLDGMSGLKDIEDQCIKGVFTPFTLEKKLYALPLTNDFPMLFVRTDIFKMLNLKVPDTWDDVLDITQIIERNNMSLGCAPSFATLIYQNNGEYFNEKLSKVMFDSDIAINSMNTIASFYTIFGFPLSFDMVSRFRTGEMPIAIAGYSTYSMLQYSAPEINGLWQMYPTPGKLQPNGSINYTWADAGGSGIAMLAKSSTEKKEAAWEFMSWFCNSKTQTNYGIDLETNLGIAGRYATANEQTLNDLNWSGAEKKVLNSELKRIKYIPIVPGNYYISRSLNNAQRAVLYDGVNSREALKEWTEKINYEINRKRNEFSLNN